jgi:DNA-directed RNA polymerase specialized sigma24 family protein
MTTLSSSMSRARITAMLSDTGLLESIETVLLIRGVPESEVPDMIQEAFMAAFRVSPLPESDAAARQYLFGIVRNKAKMLIRDWHERNYMPFDDEIHGAASVAPFEERDLLRKIVAQVPDSRWQSFLWFRRVTFGESLAEIAREEGVDYATAHARYARMRVDLRRWATQIAAVTVVLLVLFAGFQVLRPTPEVSHPPPIVVPPPHSAEPIAGQPRERAEAADLRRRAFDECAAKQWSACERDLDEAKLRDPHGENDPRVEETRRALSLGSGPR